MVCFCVFVRVKEVRFEFKYLLICCHWGMSLQYNVSYWVDATIDNVSDVNVDESKSHAMTYPAN